LLLFIFVILKFSAQPRFSRLLQIAFVKNYMHQKIVSHLLNFPQIARAISASNRKYDNELMVYPCRAKYLQRSGTKFSVKSQEKRDFSRRTASRLFYVQRASTFARFSMTATTAFQVYSLHTRYALPINVLYRLNLSHSMTEPEPIKNGKKFYRTERQHNLRFEIYQSHQNLRILFKYKK